MFVLGALPLVTSLKVVSTMSWCLSDQHVAGGSQQLHEKLASCGQVYHDWASSGCKI